MGTKSIFHSSFIFLKKSLIMNRNYLFLEIIRNITHWRELRNIKEEHIYINKDKKDTINNKTNFTSFIELYLTQN